MKKILYGIAESHDITRWYIEKSYLTMDEMEDCMSKNPVPDYIVDVYNMYWDMIPRIEKLYKNKVKKLKKKFEEINPKVFFLEGRDADGLIEDIGFDGDLVFLDENLEVFDEIGYMIGRRDEIEVSLLDDPDGVDKKKLIEESKRIEKKINKKQEEREELWVRKILDNYEEPSVINVGAHHLNRFYLGEILTNMISERRLSIHKFLSLLRGKGIKIKVIHSDMNFRECMEELYRFAKYTKDTIKSHISRD